MPSYTQREVKKRDFRLTLPVRALSTSVNLPRSSGAGSWSVSDTGRLVLVVSPLKDTRRSEVSFMKKDAWDSKQLCDSFTIHALVYPMSCSCDRSLEKGMKSTTLRRALDLREPAAKRGQLFGGSSLVVRWGYSFFKLLNANVCKFICKSLGIQSSLLIYVLLLQKCVLTSLYGALFPFCAGEGMNEVSEGTMATEELLIGAALCDFSIYQHEDMVSLRQEAHPMGHQDAGLYRKPHKTGRLDGSTLYVN